MMKLNWGHKLVLFTILFMGFIVWLVTAMSREKLDLVDRNYYEQGIKYQEEINKYNISDSIHPQIIFDIATKQLSFSANLNAVQGTITFYRPSNSQQDFEVPFELKNSNVFVYDAQGLSKGLWKIIVEWEHEGRKMASEKQIRVE